MKVSTDDVLSAIADYVTALVNAEKAPKTSNIIAVSPGMFSYPFGDDNEVESESLFDEKSSPDLEHKKEHVKVLLDALIESKLDEKINDLLLKAKKAQTAQKQGEHPLYGY